LFCSIFLPNAFWACFSDLLACLRKINLASLLSFLICNTINVSPPSLAANREASYFCAAAQWWVYKLNSSAICRYCCTARVYSLLPAICTPLSVCFSVLWHYLLWEPLVEFEFQQSERQDSQYASLSQVSDIHTRQYQYQMSPVDNFLYSSVEEAVYQHFRPPWPRLISSETHQLPLKSNLSASPTVDHAHTRSPSHWRIHDTR